MRERAGVGLAAMIALGESAQSCSVKLLAGGGSEGWLIPGGRFVRVMCPTILDRSGFGRPGAKRVMYASNQSARSVRNG